ncbi:MAG: ABC transporter permease subunit [Mesorhizobium sp.]|nr:MAG: ABC transporter permease subunit [Mesorhizobium sp.]
MIRRSSSRAIIGQWILLAALVIVAWFLIATGGANLARRNMSLDFGFLANRANFDIPFHLISWQASDTYGRALIVALLNTLLVSVMGIIGATLLGLLVGIMRLSANWLVRNVALVFIEAVRNTPQVVQIVFWYVAVLQSLPPPRQSIDVPGGILLNARGVYLPFAVMNANGALLSFFVLAALIATPFVWRLRLRDRPIGIRALVLPLVALGSWVAGVERIEWPALKGFNVAGGTAIPPELVVLWAGLTIYSAAFIAEIVRGSIEAVPKGQREAAVSLGLKFTQVLFLIVLPQALRMMVPPLTNQYLNLIKSSSLGAFIAYPEIFQIVLGTVLSQSDRGVESIILVMVVFLTINLAASAFMNWYNGRVAMVVR